MRITKAKLDCYCREKGWVKSAYNEDTEDELIYYMNERECAIGDAAYLYSKEYDDVTKMKIQHIISRSDAPDTYDALDDDVLWQYESVYDADTSAEFITDKDCYLVWFKEV